MYRQHHIDIVPCSRGCHLITSQILTAISADLRCYHIGMLNLFLQHTSASLTINENYDSDVRLDLEDAMRNIVPDHGQKFCSGGSGSNNKSSKLATSSTGATTAMPAANYRHDAEGDDDMPAHVKASLLGASINIPISNGKLALGTWQGIWLCEHRNHGGTRRIIATLHGVPKNTPSSSSPTS